MSRAPLQIPLAAFGVRVADVQHAWLEVACWKGVTLLPVRTLGQDDLTLGALMGNLRCRGCHQSPASVALVGAPQQGSVEVTGGWAGWRVDLSSDRSS